MSENVKMIGKLHFIQSRWGGKLLVVNNYLFTSNKQHANVQYWRCTFSSIRKKNPCNVKCRTKCGKVVNLTGIHNHPPTKKNVQNN